MEERNTIVLQEENTIGEVQIADDVVAMIASLATKEVEGVSSAAGNMTGELMNKVGIKNAKKSVKVDILQKNVTVDVALVVEYGYNIPAVCQKVQAKVKSTIENMTGLNVADVNIRIVGVNMQK